MWKSSTLSMVAVRRELSREARLYIGVTGTCRASFTDIAAAAISFSSSVMILGSAPGLRVFDAIGDDGVLNERAFPSRDTGGWTATVMDSKPL
jgi:hypothetical protein